ncbi:MAG: helix-turn-helix transcriptional regulator [Gemmatimonadales bacterium]|nr:helix-turn-helix transcriptional regulator [Gemmatimonadales bacterium]
MDTLSERLRLLVELRYAGSVIAAARASGMSQETIARVASGTMPDPGTDVLSTVADHFDVGVEWLETGTGRGPDIRGEGAPSPIGGEWRDWNVVMSKLGFPHAEASALMWASALQTDMIYSCIVGAEGDTDRIPRETPPIVEAMRKNREAWVTLIDEWIRLQGVDAVRRIIAENQVLFWTRFVRPEALPEATRARLQEGESS